MTTLRDITPDERRKAVKDLLIKLSGQHKEAIGHCKKITKYHRNEIKVIDGILKSRENVERCISSLKEEKERTFICPWCGEEKPLSIQCSKGYCQACSSMDITGESL
jgi:hypothetical protein